MQNTDFPYSWGHLKRYNDFSTYFRKLFSGRVQKVSLDAGFTCPNRDGTKGLGGCTYCNNKTFKPDYCNLGNSIEKQLNEGIAFFSKKYSAIKFIAYFQAYTNTYAPIEKIKEIIEIAICNPEIVGVVLATRPDCLSVDILDYLQTISEKHYLMVELGVESCEDDTLRDINRGHTFAESKAAILNLAERKIHNCIHMIAGLPGEDRETILKQPVILSQLPVENIKIHQLQIHRGTVMEKQYRDNPQSFNIFNDVDEYVELMIDYLELLNPSVIVERFVSYTPSGFLIAPGWGLKNFEFVAKVEKRLKERNTWQGRLYIPLEG
ncbi:MAG: TIGR01212 family radical SAM protein [Prolixibacteraceae bacterium]|nr:TIGR01212 family radical SAM protein [Prolixibacteraceae bacterium]